MPYPDSRTHMHIIRVEGEFGGTVMHLLRLFVNYMLFVTNISVVSFCFCRRLSCSIPETIFCGKFDYSTGPLIRNQ